MTLTQLLGRAIPYVEVGRKEKAGVFAVEMEDDAAGRVDCNVIMKGHGGGFRMLGGIGGVEEEWVERKGKGSSGSGGEHRWMKGDGGLLLLKEEEERGMNAIRSALKASRRSNSNAANADGDDDDSREEKIREAEAREALKGVGVEELTRRMNALHAEQQQQQQQQHASTGINAISYLNTMRFNR